MAAIRFDPAIKLFGTTIPLPPPPPPSAARDVVGEEAQDLQITEATPESVPKNNDSRRVELPPPISPKAGKIMKLSSTNGEIASPKVPEHEEQATESNGSKDKTLKKPDKIVPCPRCKSLDTKFCYFNNYNVNQPRHFCKNCQRYWTAGGTMRNVPVGAGRRKTKSSGPHYRHLTTSDPPSSNHSGTVLTFGSDSESVVSVLNPAEGRHRNSDDRPGLLENSNEDSPRAPIPYVNGTPWPYPAFCNSSFPIPFYHGPAYWAVPWLSPLAASSPRSDLDRPKLVGHLKEGDDGPKERKEERCIWVPKTLRIDNPEEAAKSSIWAMLGVKIDKGEENNHRSEASKVLHANPAALSRSVIFHEIS